MLHKRIFFCLLACIAGNAFGVEFKLFEDQGKVGLKDDQGAVVLPPSFEALGWSDGSFSVIGQITGYKLNGSWGLINLKKEYITKAEFESLTYSGSDRVVAIKNMQGISRKAGSLKLTGEITIPFIYDDIDLHGLRAVVMNKVGIHYRFGLTDLENHALLPLEYNNIYPLSTLRFAVENKDGRIALFSDNGKPITDFFIDSISVFHRGHAIIHSGGRQGVIDAAGGVLVAPAYGEIKFLPDGKLRALQPDGWKVIDDKNKEVRNIQVDGLSLFRDGYYRITLAGKQGLIDQNLLPVWPAIFDRIDAYKDGLVAAKKNNKWGLIDITLKEALPFAFDSLIWDGQYAFALSVGLDKSGWMFYNIAENLKSPKKYDAIEKLSGPYFKVSKNGYAGLLSRQAKETVHCVYDSIVELSGNQVSVVFKNQFGIISVNEDWILAPQAFRVWLVNDQVYLEQQQRITFLKSFAGDIIYFTENPLKVLDDHLVESRGDGGFKKIDFFGLEVTGNLSFKEAEGQSTSDDYKIFESQGKVGFRDGRGRLVIPNRYDSVKAFSDGAVAFKLLGRWGYLNREDKIIINPSFDFASGFHNGFAIVATNRKFGLINKNGKVVLSLQYDSITRSDEKLLLFKLSRAGLATLEGKVLVEPRYDYLRVLRNGQILVRLDSKFGVISSDGLNIVPIVYSSLEYDENKNLYLAHLESSWINLDR